jgi:hypothetical protein
MLAGCFWVHGIAGTLASIALLVSRGAFLIPKPSRVVTLATDAWGCALGSLGLLGLLLARRPDGDAGKRDAAVAFAVYHAAVTAGALRQATRKAGGGGDDLPATAKQGAGSVAVHGATALWFLAFLARGGKQ